MTSTSRAHLSSTGSGINNALFFATLALCFSLPLSESIKNIFFAILSLLWLALILRRQNRWPSLLTPLSAAHLALVAVALVSAATAYDPWMGLRGTWDLLRAFIFFLILATAGFNSRQIFWIMVAMAGGVVIGSFWGFWDLYIGAKDAFQIHSLGHENHTATYLLLTQCLLLGFLLTPGVPRWVRVFSALSGSLIVVDLVLTQSRLAWVTFVIVLVVLSLRARRPKPMLFVGQLAVILYALSMLRYRGFWVKSFHRVRLEVTRTLANPIGSFTEMGRLKLWRESLSSLWRFPFLGVGPRNFHSLSKLGYATWTNHAHSLFVNAAVEMGLVGLGALLSYLSMYLWTWRQMVRHSLEGIQHVLATAILGAWLTIVISGLLNTTFHTEGAMLFVGLMGLFLASADAETLSGKGSGLEFVLSRT